MKGILFKPDMLRAIMDGTKTQTRRPGGLKVINQEPDAWHLRAKFKDILFEFGSDKLALDITLKPRYRVGEVVYCKEAWCQVGDGHDNPFVVYKLTTPDQGCKWQSPLFMPAWAARTFIQIKDVRPERLQEITISDCYAEGYRIDSVGAQEWYARLWDSINPKHPWDENDWIWRYHFKVIPRPEVIL